MTSRAIGACAVGLASLLFATSPARAEKPMAPTVAECSRPMSMQVLHEVAVVSMQVAAAIPISTAARTGCVATLAAKMNPAASR